MSKKVDRLTEMSKKADEDYLRTAMMLKIKNGTVNANTIAEALDVTISSSYTALNKLVEAGYIKTFHGKRGRNGIPAELEFTFIGEEKAKEILSKHEMILDWLLRLGVNPHIAEKEACHMEHGISNETIKIIEKHVDMASRMVLGGEGKKPDEIMKMISMKKDLMNNEVAINKSIYHEAAATIRECGGIENVKKAYELIQSEGGISEIKENLYYSKFINKNENIKKVLDDVKEDEDFFEAMNLYREISEMGSIEDVKKSISLVKKLGDINECEALVNIMKKVENTKKLEEIIDVFLKLKKLL